MIKKYYFKLNPLSSMVFNVYNKKEEIVDGKLKEEIVEPSFEVTQDDFFKRIEELIDFKKSVITFKMIGNVLVLEYIKKTDNSNSYNLSYCREEIEFDSNVLSNSHFKFQMSKLNEHFKYAITDTKINLQYLVKNEQKEKSIDEQVYNIIFQYINNKSINKIEKKDVYKILKKLNTKEALKAAKEIYLTYGSDSDKKETFYDVLFSLSIMANFAFPLYAFYKSDNVIELLASFISILGINTIILMFKNKYITEKNNETLEQIKDNISSEYKIKDKKHKKYLIKNNMIVSNLTHM